MKWYLVGECDNTVEDPVVIDSGELIRLDEYALMKGERVASWEPPTLRVFKAVNDGAAPDDVLQNHLWLPIFSSRLRKAIETAGINDIQYLDVEVRRRSGAKLSGFMIGNIITRRPALDTTRSDFDRFPDDYFLADRRGLIVGLRMPVLRGDLLDGCDIVRVDKYPITIYVSERFRRMFERHRFTGWSFAEARLYSIAWPPASCTATGPSNEQRLPHTTGMRSVFRLECPPGDAPWFSPGDILCFPLVMRLS